MFTKTFDEFVHTQSRASLELQLVGEEELAVAVVQLSNDFYMCKKIVKFGTCEVIEYKIKLYIIIVSVLTFVSPLLNLS